MLAVRRGAFVTIATIASLAGSAGAALPGDNGKIAFVGKGSQIYVVRPDGTHVRRLTDSASEKSSPSFSPNGRRLAFAHLSLDPSRETHFQISIMDADGDHRHQLTHGRLDNSSPSFGPTGDKLAFTRAGSIYLMRLDGSHKRPVTKGQYPAFSPNGRRIVFEGSDTKPGDVGTPRDKRGIFIVDVDGSRRRELTRNPMGPPDNYGTSEPGHIDHDPSFSPDGERIVFVRAPNQCLSGTVYVMSSAGKHVHAVTKPADGSCGGYYKPSFSPDGRKIVVAAPNGLYVMRSDGTHRHKLLVAGGGDSDPDWQPLPR